MRTFILDVHGHAVSLSDSAGTLSPVGLRDWLNGDITARLDHIHTHLLTLESGNQRELEADMTTNDELAGIKASLTEASTEIPAKLDELLAAIEAGDPADPALVAEVKALAAGLADIVPNVEPEPEPEPETPVEEVPAEETPEAPASE